jgi:hypothetical protein
MMHGADKTSLCDAMRQTDSFQFVVRPGSGGMEGLPQVSWAGDVGPQHELSPATMIVNEQRAAVMIIRLCLEAFF